MRLSRGHTLHASSLPPLFASRNATKLARWAGEECGLTSDPRPPVMIWNTPLVRVTVGLLLLAAGVVALLPTLTGYTSLDGTVNAPIGIVSAPIEGVVTNNPPK